MKATITILALLFAATGAYAQQAVSPSPFSSYETRQLSEVWPEIRQAESFRDIDWETVGLDEAPGDAQARRLMAEHWGSIREAEDFRDIDWEQTAGYEDDSFRSRFENEGEDPLARRDARSSSTGPFTQHEADLMSAVWDEIRETESFREIDWEEAGLDFAPGDAEARRIMAENWDALREAAEFDDIDWEATMAYRDRDRLLR